VSAATNQIVGQSYDANGNQYNGFQIYDVENRLTSTNGLTYAYDAQNKRIWSSTGAVDGYGNTTNYTVNLYSPSGQKLGAYLLAPWFVQNSQTMWTTVPSMQVTLASSDQYFGSRRLAAMDQLGSVGNYFPWGEDKGGTSPQNTWNYATYWRDSASGLDYANNRYYNNAYGRFMTPDPYTASGGPNDPQSWNRYAYTRGDPVNRYDPAGMADSTPTFTDTVFAPPYDDVSTPNTASIWSWGAAMQAAQSQTYMYNLRQKIKGKIATAFASALRALQNNADCAKDLGQGTNNGSPVSASGVLNSIFVGGIYGDITVGDLKSPSGTTVSAQTSGVVVQTGAGTLEEAAIVINDLGGTFVGGSAQDQAVTLLHELGHAMNNIFGAGTSKVKDDGTSVANGVQISMDNTAMIKKDCFK
jgi:RHS repeat-associated protein